MMGQLADLSLDSSDPYSHEPFPHGASALSMETLGIVGGAIDSMLEAPSKQFPTSSADA